MLRALPLVFLLAWLPSCSGEAALDRPEPRDPAVAAALGDPLMTDPDLSTRNEAAAALTVVTDGPLPALRIRPEAVTAARARAAELVGGADKLVPVPAATGRTAPLPSGAAPADHLAVLKDQSACRATLDDSTIWAARLPGALAVYPGGATLAATGGQGTGCQVIAVLFAAPAPPNEVLAFYWQRTRAAGLAPAHRSAGSGSALQGRSGGTAFDLRVDSGEDGQTIVRIAVVTG